MTMDKVNITQYIVQDFKYEGVSHEIFCSDALHKLLLQKSGINKYKKSINQT